MSPKFNNSMVCVSHIHSYQVTSITHQYFSIIARTDTHKQTDRHPDTLTDTQTQAEKKQYPLQFTQHSCRASNTNKHRHNMRYNLKKTAGQSLLRYLCK